MKTTTVRSLAISVLAALSFGFTGCTKSDRADASAKTGEVIADTKDALSQGWDNVKTFTFDKRDDFRANAKAMTAKMDARMSELHANYSEAKASASRKAAMAEFKDSDAAYKEKLEALGTATADTWDSAKQNVISAWDRLQASYYKARAD
jgi:major membrane immunogen (membrane-anchored lipoprotein)